MPIKTKLSLAFLLLAGICFPQNEPKPAAPPEEPKYFRLDFAVKELEGGKVTNSRSYFMIVSTAKGSFGDIKAGSRMPLYSGGDVKQYIDTGVNIRCGSTRDVDSKLALDVIADITGTAAETLGSSTPIRQTSWRASVIFPIGKPTTIFSSDDPSLKRTMQLEVTATPIK